MKILSRNAAAVLFEKANELESLPHATWRCIHLNLSEEARQNPMPRDCFVVRTLTELLAEDDGYIYLLDDGDIFILFQGALKPMLAKLGKHFEDVRLARPAGETGDSVVTIYDLGTDWNAFLRLCRIKSLKAQPLWQNLSFASWQPAVEKVH